MTAPRIFNEQDLRRPPLREEPDKPDMYDPVRIELVKKRFHSQDAAYTGYSKTVEEHVRMLAGRQWDVWSDLLGRFVDVLRFMSESEKKHKMRPAMDFLGYWFLLTLSKATENAPVISFLPATSDRTDAMLAEVMDPVWKTLFDEMEVDDRVMRAVGWALVAGEAYFFTRAEFSQGDERELIAPAVLSMTGQDGSLIERVIDHAPYGADGNPLAQLVADPENEGEYGYETTGDPHVDREGVPKIDVLCPLEVRAQWGQHIAWLDKRWVIHRWFLTPDEVEERFGIRLEPDHYPADDESGPGYLERLLFGSGYFGATGGEPTAQGTDQSAKRNEGYVCGLTMWEKPIQGFTDETEDQAGGRLLVVAPGADKVLWDSMRPAKFECAGPIRKLSFLDIPGRPFSSTPLEKMVPLQRRLNRVEAQVAEHTNLCTNPVLMLHEAAGIDDDEFEARPGLTITHGYNGPGQPAYWLAPPALSADVWRHKGDIREQLFTIGSMMGNQSQTPTESASGELVEQLRFNADRPLAPLTRSLVLQIANIAQDLLALLPTIWTAEKMITYAGSDNVVRTVTVLPEMFKGRVNVKPSIESASAESKERRRARVQQLYQLGAFGNIADPVQQPKAVATMLELMNYPDLTRASRPGGVDRVMAEHNLGRLVRGEPAQAIPILEVYDIGIHLFVTEGFMKSPEYLALDEGAQEQFVIYREMLLLAGTAQQMNAIERAAPVAQAQALLQGSTERVGMSAAGGPEQGKPDSEGGPAKPSAGPHSPSSPPRSESAAA